MTAARVILGGIALALGLAACDYRRDLGDPLGLPDFPFGLPDAATGARAGCDDFVPPSSDCTLIGTACLIEDGCAPDQTCNTAQNRCYPSEASCVGTSCQIDRDCGRGAVCNLFAGVCFDPLESQTCMPCVSIADCGASLDCDVETNRCVDG